MQFAAQQPKLASVESKRIAAVVLIYAIFAASWILVSDQIVHLLFRDPEHIFWASMLKGWFYVAITSLLLYGLMRRWFGPSVQANSEAPSSRTSIFLLSFLIVVILGLMASSVFYAVNQHRNDELRRMRTLANLQARQINDWFVERRGDAVFVQTSEFFLEQYQRWQFAGDMQSAERMQNRLRQFADSQGIFAVSVFNSQGERLWQSANAPAELDPGLDGLIQTTLTSRQIQSGHPYPTNGGRMLLDFVVPLTAQSGPAPMVVFHTNLGDWLISVLENRPMELSTGESMLLRRDGDRLVYLNRPRFWPDAAVPMRMSLDGKDPLSAQAFQLADRWVHDLEADDYRHKDILGVALAVSNTDWVLLSKLDKVELYAKAKSEVVWIICVGGLTIFIACAGYYVLRQSQSLAIAQAVQKSQAEQLRALELLSNVANLSTDAIFAKDLAGCYTLFNTAASNFVGKPVEDVLGKDDSAIFPTEQADYLRQIGRKVIASNITVTEEETLDTAAGPRVFLATKGPLRDVNGKVIGIFGISRDITQRKQAELELRESEARFRGLVEQALAGIYIWQKGGFVYVNPGFAAIFGYRDPQDIVGCKALADLVCSHDCARVMADIQRVHGDDERVLHDCFAGLRRDGHSIYVEMHGRAFQYQGEPAVIGFLIDITARKNAEDQLMRQAEELRKRNDELERFNRAMVGREIAMIELKRQVNSLSRELGRPAPYTTRDWSEGEAGNGV